MTGEEKSSISEAQQRIDAALAADAPAKTTRALTHLLEDLVPIPGTKYRVGIDPLLSFIPWAGTAAGALFGTAVMFDAIRLRAPVPVLVRMLGNWVIDWLVGLIPYAGVLLDWAWRSNSKNLKLLNRTIADRKQVHDATVLYWITVAAIVFCMIALTFLVPILLIVFIVTRG